MTDSPRKPGSADLPADASVVRSVGRRRWLQAGISAAPVLMTIASRPVLATGTKDCRAPSGFVSGFASGAPVGQCGGGHPSHWCKAGTGWPSGCKKSAPNATKFNSIFDPNLNNDPTLFAVLSLAGTPLQSYIAAAYLNNAATLVPDSVLPLDTIKDMWNLAGPSGGLYVVNAKVSWNNLGVIEYLKSTMTLS